jgi:hypothetical protein
MRIKICIIAAICGIAVAAGIWESLSSHQKTDDQKNEHVRDVTLRAQA